jgi:predicted lipoprotein
VRPAAAAILLLLASCGRDPGLKERALQDLAYEVILPGYRAFAAEAGRLARAVEALQAAPSAASLEAVRQAWKDARSAWGRCGAHLIGPENDRLLHAKVSRYPASEARLEALIASAAALDDAGVERAGANMKGFFAIEALVFDAPHDRSARPGESRRRELLLALARNLARTAAEIREAWEDDKGGFARAFSRAGSPGSAFASRQAAFDLLINHLVVFAERTADQLARPAGLTVAAEGRVDASLIEARRSDHGLDDLQTAVESLRRICEGLRGPVAQAAPDLDRAIRGAVEVARRDLSAIPPPLATALTSRAEEVRAAVVGLRALKLRVATDLVSVYRTTLTVSPFDGD